MLRFKFEAVELGRVELSYLFEASSHVQHAENRDKEIGSVDIPGKTTLFAYEAILFNKLKRLGTTSPCIHCYRENQKELMICYT